MNRQLRHTRSAFLCLAMFTAWAAPEARSSVFQQKDGAKKSATSAAPATPERVAPEKLREDFRILRGAFEEGHPGIYRYTPKSELDKHFDQAEKALDRPMDAYEFYRVVAPAVATLKCGHTGVRVNPDLDKGKRVLPLAVRLLNGKIYVLRDLSGAQRTLAGQEIVAVNGVAAANIVQRMLAAMPADGDVQTARLRRVGANFAGELIDLLGLESPYAVTFKDAEHSREGTVLLEGVARARLQQPRPRDSAELTFLDDGKIADLKIYRFGGTAKQKDLRVFIPDCFKEIDKKKSSALILDLRDNGGGADDLGKLLLSFLVDEPFKYYDDLVLNGVTFGFQKYTAQKRGLPANMLERQPNGKYRMVKHPNWGIQQPSKPNFTGKVYILMNGNSFSTTSEFLSHAHARRRATFIGEESGGGYYGNTSGPGALLTLPNTKLQAYVPLMTYYMAVHGYKAASHGVVPDHPVNYTIDELLAGNDKELAV
ncbi:MAG TPA: S41 family peptidase, partial [Gemmataceae bacterium]|nr:S41 family peptidase [Gemmataceae bacterium]